MARDRQLPIPLHILRRIVEIEINQHGIDVP